VEKHLVHSAEQVAVVLDFVQLLLAQFLQLQVVERHNLTL